MLLNNVRVLSVNSKPGKGKFATMQFHQATVQDPTGMQYKVDFGTVTPPGIGETFTCQTDDAPTYGAYKMIRGTYIGPASSATHLAPAGSLQAAPRPGQFPVPEDSKDISIIRQNSLGHAVELVNNMFHIFFPGTGEAITEDQLTRKVIEVAFLFSQFSSGKLEMDVKETLAQKLTK